MSFRIGDLVHNRISNDHGRVTELITENGEVVYVVAVPMDPTSWTLGARESHWPESEVEPSTNDLLDHDG